MYNKVKQPRNRSGPLSLIMASVYYPFHALPIFPHGEAHLRMYVHIYAPTRTVYYEPLLRTLSGNCGSRLVVQI